MKPSFQISGAMLLKGILCVQNYVLSCFLISLIFGNSFTVYACEGDSRTFSELNFSYSATQLSTWPEDSLIVSFDLEATDLLVYEFRFDLELALAENATIGVDFGNSWSASGGEYTYELTLSEDRTVITIKLSRNGCVPVSGQGEAGTITISNDGESLDPQSLVQETDGWIVVDNLDLKRDLEGELPQVVRREDGNVELLAVAPSIRCIQIHDLWGRVWFEGTISGHSPLTIQVGRLPKGIYLLQVLFKSGKAKVKKFIVGNR